MRLVSGGIAVAAMLGVAATAAATDYSEMSIISAPYVDTDGKTYISYHESADLSSDPTAPTDIGALTVGSNFITGATIPYGPIGNPMTGELAHQDGDYVTFTVPGGTALTNIDLLAPPPTWIPATGAVTPMLDGSSIEPGDLFFVGIASGAQVMVHPPSSSGLLGFSLLTDDAIGHDILPGLGSLAAPPPFNGPPFLGATKFTGALPAGTYSLWLLDGNDPVSYKLDLVVAPVPEPSVWAMYLGGFAMLGLALRRRRRATIAFT